MPPPPTTKTRSKRQNTPSTGRGEISNRQDIEGYGRLQEGGEAAARLADLPGFGPRLVERAVAALGSPEAVLQALEEGHIDPLAQIAGIGPRLALRLMHAVHGTDPDAFFATPQAAQGFERFQKQLMDRAQTRGGKNRLRLLAPHPDRAERARRLEWCRQAAEEAADLDLEGVRAALARLAPLPPLKASFEAEVLLLFDDAKDLQAAHDAGAHRWASLAHLRSGDRLERVQEAHVVVHASRDPASRPHQLDQADHLLTVPFSQEPARLAPWGTLERHRKARATLEAAATLSRLRARDSASEKALILLDEHPARPAAPSPDDIETRAQVILEEELQSAEKELAGLTMTGSDLVRAMNQELPSAVTRVYQQAAQRANLRLEQETGVSMDAYTETTPPRVQEHAIGAAVASAARSNARDHFENDLRLAHRLLGLEREIARELEEHEAFDARQAMGSMIHDHGLSAPQWGETGGLLVEGMQPLDVGPDAETVDYRLGLHEDGDPDTTQVALLTGANSGGKTTLLGGLTLLVALAHAGLYVPARRAIVPPLDSVHLYAPSRDRGAGALESLLLDLFPLIEQPGRRLVFADELEAMTELEAASEILGALLEGLIEQGTHAVLATHLAPHLLPALNENARAHTRIDGIEAHGLDENGRLQVTRSPRLDHLARSTPELILRRLATHGPPELAPRFQALAKRVHERLEREGSNDPTR